MWAIVWTMFSRVFDPQKSECLCGLQGFVVHVDHSFFNL